MVVPEERAVKRRAALLTLGISGLVAAWQRAEGLAPLGLAAGALLIGVVWERPQPTLGSEPPG